MIPISNKATRETHPYIQIHVHYTYTEHSWCHVYMKQYVHFLFIKTDYKIYSYRTYLSFYQ